MLCSFRLWPMKLDIILECSMTSVVVEQMTQESPLQAQLALILAATWIIDQIPIDGLLAALKTSNRTLILSIHGA